jgi:hypothetical protein|tara:strand:+ start:848 stop:1219 length:372 start_codon:yes stop_codon:yes gene_type:complete
MSSYTGMTPDHINGSVQDRFFYGLRRTDNGELFIGKADQLKATDSVTINKSGDPKDNLKDFSEGSDFFEGRDIHHELVYKNLNYEQFQWNDRNIAYYIDSNGELVASVNQKHTYDENSSSNGL